jgi:hypothetical protein
VTPLVNPVTATEVGTTVVPGFGPTMTSGTRTPFEANELWTVKLVIV